MKRSKTIVGLELESPGGNYVELDIDEGVYEIYVQGDRITSTIGKVPIGKVPIGKPQILVTDPPNNR